MKVPEYEWWVEHAHEDSSLLLLMRDEQTFIELVTQAAVKANRTDIQRLVNHCMYRACFEQDRFGSMSSILKDIQPTESPSLNVDQLLGRPFKGALRVDNKAIRDDSGTFPMLGLSAFWAPWALQNNPDQFSRMADWATECGMTYARWFGSHNWTGGIIPNQHADYFELMEHTIEQLAAHGLRSQITLFTRSFLIDDKTNAVSQWANLVNEHRDKVCLVELCNEFNHDDNEWSMWEVQSLGKMFTDISDVPFALSAPAAETWDDGKEILSQLYEQGNASATTIHFPRYQSTHEGAWRWVRQPWHGRWSIDNCPSVVIDNEHQRWDKSAGGKVIEVAAAAPFSAFISGCAMSAHHDVYGVHSDKGEYVNDERASALKTIWSRTMPLLPRDVANWQSVRVGDGGGPHPFPTLVQQEWSHNASLDHGVSRCFAAVRDDLFVMLLAGVKNYVTLRELKQKPYQVISLLTGQKVYEGSGDVRLNESDGKAFLVLTV